MRICIVTETFWPEMNEIATMLFRLVDGLSRHGHQVQLVCPHLKNRDSSQFPADIFYQAVKGFSVPRYKEVTFGLPSSETLLQLWKNEKPDVIYVATEGPLGWSAVNEANKQGIPIASGFHTNYRVYCQYYSFRFLEKAVRRYLINLHNKTNTTVVATKEKQQYLLNMGIRNVSILSGGVDTRFFTPEKRSEVLRQQWGVNAKDPVMLYVGGIAEEKNLDLAIRTYFVLHSMNKKLKFVLVGDGSLAKKLKRDHPNFIFAGMKQGEELAIYYASSDLFISPSTTEIIGNVVLEAMASGLGVVAYDYGSAHLHIESGQRGLLARKNNAEKFIDNAKLLMRDVLVLKKLRTNAVAYAKTKSWESTVNHFETILKFCENANYISLERADLAVYK